MAEPPGTRTVTMPFRIYRKLLARFEMGWAYWSVRSMLIDPERRQRLPTANQFADVFAWVWDFDRGEAMIVLADYLAALHDCQEKAGDAGPLIELDELLLSLRGALPHGFSDHAAVERLARREVPDVEH